MITCSDLHGRTLYINADLLQSIESTPDTQLVFINGHRLFVSETPEAIIDRIVAFRCRIGCGVRPSWLSDMPQTEDQKE